MARLRLGVVRFASVAAASEQAIGGEPLPRCEIGRGRLRLTFRGRGASRWPEAQQVTFAFQVAALARGVLSADERERVRARVSRAILAATLLTPGADTTRGGQFVAAGRTDREGQIRLTFADPGSYVVRIRRIGYEPLTRVVTVRNRGVYRATAALRYTPVCLVENRASHLT